MINDQMKSGVFALRPFVPAEDFQRSRSFYEAFGFEPLDLGPNMTSFKLGAFGFFLQDFYVKEFAANFMIHLLVDDLDIWWTHIEALNLNERFGVKPPRPPKLERWGLRVGYVFYRAGVLWHVVQDSA